MEVACNPGHTCCFFFQDAAASRRADANERPEVASEQQAIPPGTGTRERGDGVATCGSSGPASTNITDAEAPCGSAVMRAVLERRRERGKGVAACVRNGPASRNIFDPEAPSGSVGQMSARERRLAVAGLRRKQTMQKMGVYVDSDSS